jgi:hypothetical protein
MTTQPQLLSIPLEPADVVYTPDWVARDMVEFFKPSGKILEPSLGDGGIYKYLPTGAEWCEITKGRDFFQWEEPVDWIIGNPPYSMKLEWLRHSMTIAKNIVYLFPCNTPFNSSAIMLDLKRWGNIKHLRYYGSGGSLGFPFGYPVGAILFVRDYRGDTSWSWYAANGKD